MATTDIPRPPKKQRTGPKVRVFGAPIPPGLTRSALKVIGTHNGTFHCDEALAVYMLRLTENYRDAGYYFHAMDVAWRSSNAVKQTSNAPETLPSLTLAA